MDRVDRIVAQWRKERPDLDVGPMELIGRLGRLMLHLRREMEATFTNHGLSGASFDVLATLRRSGAPYRLSPTSLMASTMVTSGTMTNRIDQLVKAGLVERTPNPEDGRSFLIGLTEDGFARIDAAVTAHVETQKRLAGQIGEDECAALNAMLRTCLARFEPPEDEGASPE